MLTSAELLDTTEASLPVHRERLHPPTVTLSMFRRQTLEADASGQKAVNDWAAQRAADGLRAWSVRTGGYCRARQRLPLEMVSALTRHTGSLPSQKAGPASSWYMIPWNPTTRLPSPAKKCASAFLKAASCGPTTLNRVTQDL